MSTQSTEINKLAEALAKAQSEIVGAVKDSANPFFKSKYADLAAVWDACRLPLTKNGLSVIQTIKAFADGNIAVVTTLAHSSGQWVSGELPCFPVKKDPQAIGSAITYMRRYALAAIAGVPQIDDDGEAAQGRLAGNPGRVAPEKPGENDGVQESGVEIPYGKLAKQMVHKADPAELRDFVLEIEEKAKKLNKPIPKWAEPVIAAAEPIIAMFENGGSK